MTHDIRCCFQDVLSNCCFQDVITWQHCYVYPLTITRWPKSRLPTLSWVFLPNYYWYDSYRASDPLPKVNRSLSSKYRDSIHANHNLHLDRQQCSHLAMYLQLMPFCHCRAGTTIWQIQVARLTCLPWPVSTNEGIDVEFSRFWVKAFLLEDDAVHTKGTGTRNGWSTDHVQHVEADIQRFEPATATTKFYSLL